MSTKTIIPTELFEDKENIKTVSNIIENVEKLRKTFSIKDIMYNFSIVYLKENELIDSDCKTNKSAIKIFLDEYKKYYNSNLDNKRENEKSIKLKEACSFFEDMINNGYYSVYDYAYCNGLNYESVSRKVTAYKARLRKYDKDLLDNYCASLEANRKKRFFCYKNEIDSFCLDLANSKADIVDYYIRFDMPITHFKSLCKDNVAPNQQICLNVLFDKVKDVVDVPYNKNMP